MPKRIIVIDNDLPVLEMLREALQGQGYEVIAFQDTDNVVDLVQQHPADLLIVDYILDGINGGELCQQVKKQPATTQLPVMICSGYSRVLNSLGFYNCDAFLEKPFDLTDLLEKVNRLLYPLNNKLLT
ncbi:MAG: response regulator [Sphingobacteriaceae bacterium]|nr:MAG: response regulator [Sphingobacteriaceae bacterium]